MAAYNLARNPEVSIYQVELLDDVGSRSILGFETEAAALAWIEEDRRTNVCVLPEAEPPPKR